jgi:hypothetical protein
MQPSSVCREKSHTRLEPANPRCRGLHGVWFGGPGRGEIERVEGRSSRAQSRHAIGMVGAASPSGTPPKAHRAPREFPTRNYHWPGQAGSDLGPAEPTARCDWDLLQAAGQSQLGWVPQAKTRGRSRPSKRCQGWVRRKQQTEQSTVASNHGNPPSSTLRKCRQPARSHKSPTCKMITTWTLIGWTSPWLGGAPGWDREQHACELRSDGYTHQALLLVPKEGEAHTLC